MASSHKVDPEKAAKYAIAASKGFSYYLPKSAQRHLQELRKQLPSAARSIYDEYYRDPMCAKACVPESAIAIAKFVTSSFPRVAKKHNAFSREMNEEIDNNEHEGYEPVKFPIVNELEAGEEEGATVPSKGKKRKWAPAGSTPLPTQETTPQKKAKTKPSTLAIASPASIATTPPSASPDPQLPTPVQLESTKKESPPSTADITQAADAQRLSLESISFVENEQDGSSMHEHPDWQLRNSSPLSDVSPSEDLSDDNEFFEEAWTIPSTYGSPKLPQDGTQTTLIVGEAEEHTAIVEPQMAAGSEPQDESSLTSALPATLPPSEDPSSELFDEPGSNAQDIEQTFDDNTRNESSSESSNALGSEERWWEDSMEAIQGFRWGRSASRWEPDLGRVSFYRESVEKDARLFKGVTGTTLKKPDWALRILVVSHESL